MSTTDYEHSAVRIEAKRKYLKEMYDNINIRVKSGERARIKRAAAAVGESLNQYIVRAINARMTN